MVPLSNICHGLRVAYTLTALLFILVSFLLRFGRERHPRWAVLRKGVLRIAGVGLVSLAFAVETALVAVRGAGEVQDRIISTAFFALAWASVSLRSAFPVTGVVGLSLVTLVFGIPLLAVDAAHAAEQTELPTVESMWMLVAAGLLLDGGLRLFLGRKRAKADGAGPLLNGAGVSYDTGPRAALSGDSCSSGPDTDDDPGSDDGPGDSRPGLLRKCGSWIIYVRNFRIFFPYLIPRRNPKVQACLAVCLLCMVGNRFFNILIPRQIGIVADKLVAGEAPFADLGIYLGLNLLSGDAGLSMVGRLAMIPVEQFSYRQLTNAAFSHIMRLSMDFHADRDSAELIKAIQQGEALARVLETAVLEIVPTVVDLLIAFIFLYVKFNSAVALCIVIASMAFIALEVVTSSWNINYRRRVTQARLNEARVMHQAVQGWQTVSIFNMVSHERFRFSNAVDRQLAAQKSWARRVAFIQALLQGLVPVTLFLLAGLIIHPVSQGRASPGDFIFIVQYWEFLVVPIECLSRKYRWLMSDLIDAERLLDLLTKEPTVADKEGAPALGPVGGRVEFDHVDFSYDAKRMAIRDVSFTVAPGETVALVGSTGAGKSSLAKLLMRFYDVTSGSIRIDGHDVRDVTQGSLRDVLGVVPQDPLLFNASIMDNIRYARPSASDEDVFDACRAAAVYDKILTFTDGYDTNVGEQGVKLSGGEVQRLAIARVFLKDPPILILDEATSAVDTETEAEVQGPLRMLTRKRTTLVITHRLSTIIGADQILVLHEGRIVERGSHNELLDRGGRYYSLWQKQIAWFVRGQ